MLQSTPQGWRQHPALNIVQCDLLNHNQLTHGITIKDYREQNFAYATSKDHNLVDIDRRWFATAFGMTIEQAVFANQVHGSEVEIVNNLLPQPPTCDAMITNSPGRLLCITVADCLAILFFDPVRMVIAIAHSGWRGTAANIVGKTLGAMWKEYGSLPRHCLVAVGPGISASGYEVDATVYHTFSTELQQSPQVFATSRVGHWHLDLTKAVENQLLAAGVSRSNISVSPWRTDTHPVLFHSHRMTHNCPRFAASIGLKTL